MDRNYFGHLECAVMACVSGRHYVGSLECVITCTVTDDVCMSKCAAQDFPCFDFRYENPDAVTFEQASIVTERGV